MPNAINKKLLKNKLQQIIDITAELFAKHQKYQLSVSIDIGIISLKTGISNYEELYKSADSTLYISKHLGKNQYYINHDGICCMVSNCQYCRQECSRREILRLDKKKDDQK